MAEKERAHVGTSWKQKPATGHYDAIVVGSGIGGLTAAALLSRYGHKRVLVLERHYRAGGYTHSFSRKGYDWDVGVHYIGQLGQRSTLRAMFDRLSDGAIQWAKLPEVYDRIVVGDRSYDLVSGKDRFVQSLSAAFPGKADVIARYVDLVRQTAKESSTFFLSRALPAPLGFLASRLSLMGQGHFRDVAARTTLDVLKDLTDDTELLAVLTGQYGDYGLPPAQSSFAMHATLVSHYLGGAWYPVGGAERIAQGIAPGIEAAGGHIATSAEVKSIDVEGGRAVGVTLDDGTVLRAPLVISDAGVTNTFGRLLPKSSAPAAWTQPLSSVPPSSSWYALYLGFQHTDAELGLDGTNLWIYPDAHHDENVARFQGDPTAPFPMVYASFPSAKDPDFPRRHPGRATVDLITMARWEWTEKWQATSWQKRGADYDAHKVEVTERLLEVLYQQRPQLRGKVDHAELSTPLSAAHFGGFGRGELYGIDHSPARYTLPLRPKTPIPGLFLTGVDVAVCGVGGGLMGGVLSASAILGPLALRPFLARPG
jgi:all-trans-retinol 13,14-reductase